MLMYARSARSLALLALVCRGYAARSKPHACSSRLFENCLRVYLSNASEYFSIARVALPLLSVDPALLLRRCLCVVQRLDVLQRSVAHFELVAHQRQDHGCVRAHIQEHACASERWDSCA